MSHDNSCSSYCSANPSQCSDSTTYASDAGGRYIMWPISVDGSAANNFVFSGCSRASGAAVRSIFVALFLLLVVHPR
jgi:hypothetical protein